MRFFTAAIAGLFVLGALSTAHAQLQWEQTQIELHPKASDAEAVANFKYENKGTTQINIKNVRSSCGCTVASLKKNDVAPGEKGEVTATFKIGGRTGVQQKTVTVETDDPAQPSITLLLKAIIASPLEFQPTFVYWEAGEEPKPKTIKAKASPDSKITKLDVTCSSPEFKATAAKGSGPGEFVVTVTPTDTSKPANATLTMKTDLPEPFYAIARVTAPTPATSPATAP
ncbi:MAG: DUF1573 domain-containing protein [Chthoniobacterales bacterium]